MFVIIMLRNGEIHIVDYRLGNGSYRTICSKTYSKNLQMNTLAADNTFSGTCDTCKSRYDEMYLSDLNYEPRMARNETQFKYQDVLEFHRYDIDGPRVKYEDTISGQWWPKLVKYKRLIQKR